MKKSKVFLYFCLLFIIGIAIRSIIFLDIFYAFVFLLICLAASIIFWQNKKFRIILLGAIFLFLGILRYEVSVPKINESQIGFYNNSKIEFIGQIMAEPDVREKHIKITIGRLTRLRPSNSNDPASQLDYGGQAPSTFSNEKDKIKGRVLVNVYKFNDYQYGDWVKIRCGLNQPGIIEAEDSRDFDYGQYLAVGGVYSTCYEPDLIEHFNYQLPITNYWLLNINKELIGIKQRFKEIIDISLPLPPSGLLNAMLLGYKRELPEEITAQFSQTGLSHIVAISGLHITILAGILFYLFILLGVPRQKSFWPSVIILFLYVCMIGFRASAIRAFIMGSLLLYALKIGRLNKSINALILAGVVLLMFNPKLLLWDVGFRLSFLAVLGILYFYPLFTKTLKHKNTKTPLFNSRFFNAVISIVFVTLSAQILTLPLVAYYFGIISIVSPLANLLILPILPVVMVSGVVLIILGLIWSKFALVFGFLVWILLSYILKVVELLSQIPFGHFKI